MRHIVKGTEPHELRKWKRDNKHLPENLVYDGGGFPKAALRQALLAEQHYLCAYTMKALDEQNCHIEHIYPQSRHPDRDIDYDNMLVCWPGTVDEKKADCEYGAKAKDNYDPATRPFLSPLDAGVKQRIWCASDGILQGTDPDAETTIKDVLKLNHPQLVNDRKAAVEGALLLGRKPVSAKMAREIARRALTPDTNGALRPYCIFIANWANKYADREEKRAARLKKER